LINQQIIADLVVILIYEIILFQDFMDYMYYSLTKQQIDRIIEMAWEDRTPFEAIEIQFGLIEAQVISLMRSSMKESSFKRWRKRVTGRKTKHLQKRSGEVVRFRCSRQRIISMNKISKR